MQSFAFTARGEAMELKGDAPRRAVAAGRADWHAEYRQPYIAIQKNYL